MGTMTPYEALSFVSKLKNPDLPTTERDRRVMTLLKSMGLESVKDNLIGFTGANSRNSGIKRGLSGGERKRVSIAVELVNNPSTSRNRPLPMQSTFFFIRTLNNVLERLLFSTFSVFVLLVLLPVLTFWRCAELLLLDEPTSGLDSFAAKAVMERLRDLAFMGRTIIATIHQPSYDIFRTLDELCILADGRIVYFGPAHEAVGYFTEAGYPFPKRVNPADYMSTFERSRINDFRSQWLIRCFFFLPSETFACHA
jgi:ABC-type multidrug transport system ATPase subunit